MILILIIVRYIFIFFVKSSLFKSLGIGTIKAYSNSKKTLKDYFLDKNEYLNFLKGKILKS